MIFFLFLELETKLLSHIKEVNKVNIQTQDEVSDLQDDLEKAKAELKRKIDDDLAKMQDKETLDLTKAKSDLKLDIHTELRILREEMNVNMDSR